MTRLIVAALFASAAFAQSNTSRDLKFFFNGAGVALHTESSLARSPLSTAGSVSVNDGVRPHRVVLDADDNPLFAYELDLEKLPDGRVRLRISPIDQARARREGWGPKQRVIPSGIPTLAAAREFPSLAVGDEVQVDIMYRPSTGEKLWDVLRIVDSPQLRPKNAAGERFSFERITVKIEGKIVAERPNTWMVGRALRMRVTGRGDYFLVLAPPADLPFEASGSVDHNLLRFRAGGEQVEIAGKSNILQNADYGTVWVYYVPQSSEALRRELAQPPNVYAPNHPEIRKLETMVRAAPGSAGVDFHCADNMDQLYPKEQRGKEE